MLKRLLVSALAASVLTALGALAAAADGLPTRQAYAPACAAANFAGFYMGAHGGYAIAGTNSTLFDDNNLGETLSSGNHRAGIYGAQLGYNYQRCNLVLGVEGDWSWLSGSASNTNSEPDSVKSRLRDLGSIRGRAGIVVDHVLLYATAGFGWGRANYTFVDEDEGSLRAKLSEHGLVYGAGAEFQLRENVLLRAEWLRYSFGKDVFLGNAIAGDPSSSVSYRLSDVDTLRVGLSFKFGGERRAEPMK